MTCREIIDESDVFIDVHKAIRRINPAPKSRVRKGEVITDPDDTIADGEENLIDVGEDNKDPQYDMNRTSTAEGQAYKINGIQPELGSSPKKSSYLRRTSSVQNTSDRENVQKKPMNPEMRGHLKHLGPSNLASRPRSTRYNTVKIKPGAGSFSDHTSSHITPETPRQGSISTSGGIAAQGGVGAGLVSAGKDAKDGVLAVQTGYGTIPTSPPSPKKTRKNSLGNMAERSARETRVGSQDRNNSRSRATSQSTLGSMHSGRKSPPGSKRGTARSGSITENIIDAGGIRKTVLEMTSSSEDPEAGGAKVPASGGNSDGAAHGKENERNGGKKKRRRRKRKGGGMGESEELLGEENG